MADIIRIQDYERKSKSPDAAQPRDPADADVIVLPLIRRLNAPDPDRYETHLANEWNY